jgi:alpha-amylase
VTEDEGRLLSVLPGSETLRYLIPFRDPDKTIKYLRGVADRYDNPVVIFGDDGEKFGTWPDTFRHVYEDRWLHRFLEALRENSSWLKVTTPEETLQHVAPLDTFYLPDASYREMTEWVLPSDIQQEYHRLTHIETDDADWKSLSEFTRGGFWRNFRVKYPESNEMYARMIEISSRVAELDQSTALSSDDRELLEDARRSLYRAQCNCSYWHGAFGGLYLPHLRNAVYGCLIEADDLIEQITRDEDKWVDVCTGDFNLDTRQEVRLSNHRQAAYFSPATGGHLYELDLRPCQINLLATLNRRPEAYHQKIVDHAEKLRLQAAGEIPIEEEDVESIHDIVRFKQPDLDKKLDYDRWPRKSLVDHFMQPHLTLDQYARGEGLLGDFETAAYEASVRRGEQEIALQMHGRGHVSQYDVDIRKVVVLSKDRPGELIIQYQLHGLPQQVPLHFGIEFNFATMPGGASDRYFYDASGAQLGLLDLRQSLEDCDRIGLVDEWQGLDVSLELSQKGGIWTHPIETISQSESGFELVHQSVSVTPHWEFVAPEDGPWVVDIRLIMDTSLARARQLATFGQSGEHGRTDGPAAQKKTDLEPSQA